jgi:1-hydroxycarotenoid 3,4-desaturase
MLTRLQSAQRTAAPHVVVVGAGMGGLSAALALSTGGAKVTVLEQAPSSGGKLREIVLEGRPVDSGPTVMTMRWVFDALLGLAGKQLDDKVVLTRAPILARHHWEDGATLDLHADSAATAEAIGQMAGAGEARAYHAFSAHARRVHDMLEPAFLRRPSASPLSLAREAGLMGALSLRAFACLEGVVASYFRDPRLIQLFSRYATYCGSSPYEAPGPLAMICDTEQRGVWLVGGGMRQIPAMLERLSQEQGVDFHHNKKVAQILYNGDRVDGVRTIDGDVFKADAVIFNGDPSALAQGLLGDEVRKAARAVAPRQRSLSALTLSIVAPTSGFALSRHNVFFGEHYAQEFQDIAAGRLPRRPTVYLCAQDRDAGGAKAPSRERLFAIINAPANRAGFQLSGGEIERCIERTKQRLARAGLSIDWRGASLAATSPADFAQRFPGSDGALYGMASHGPMASFRRPTARSRLPGLYLAGGAVHPGPGVPMAALSGLHAASLVASDLTLQGLSLPAATAGGISMR